MALRMPKVNTYVPATADKVLAASQTDIPASGVDIRGLGDVTVSLESSGTGNAILEVWVSKVGTTVPTASTGLSLLTVRAGTADTITNPTGAKTSHALGVTGNFLFFKGKYSSTDGSIDKITVAGSVNTGGQDL
jgi:hypothetical protein